MFSLTMLVDLKAKMYVDKALWSVARLCGEQLGNVDSYFTANTCPVLLMFVRVSKPMYASKMNVRMRALVLFVVAKGSLHSQCLS